MLQYYAVYSISLTSNVSGNANPDADGWDPTKHAPRPNRLWRTSLYLPSYLYSSASASSALLAGLNADRTIQNVTLNSYGAKGEILNYTLSSSSTYECVTSSALITASSEENELNVFHIGGTPISKTTAAGTTNTFMLNNVTRSIALWDSAALPPYTQTTTSKTALKR
jgi:hypothetical protein